MTREPTLSDPDDFPGGLAVRRDCGLRANPKYTVPNPRAGVLRRQRLVDALHENLPDTLQLISAPAGFGKTSLLADFARDTDLPVAWYGVDERDRDPYTFLRNIAAAISYHRMCPIIADGLQRGQNNRHAATSLPSIRSVCTGLGPQSTSLAVI